MSPPKSKSKRNGGGVSSPPRAAPPVAPSDEGKDPAKIQPPASIEMVAAFPGDEYRAMSAADERQIAQELQGRAPKEMLYAFNQDGKRIIGLSWVGVREAVRQVNTRGYGRIHVVPDPAPSFENVTENIETEKTDDAGQPITEERPAIRCKVYGEDKMHGGGGWGTATQLRHMRLKKKDKKGNAIWKPDLFAATKALSKAQRNAQEPFIPLELVEELKALYEGRGSIEYIAGTATEVERPPALTDERATKQVEKARKLYDEIKAKHGLALLTPARFSGYLTSAQHSHDRLDDFIAHLQETLTTGAEPTSKKGPK